MCSFAILVILVSCLLAAVLAYGASAKDKSTTGSQRSTTWKFYLEYNASRMVVTSEDGGKLIDCYISGDDYVIATTLQSVSKSKITRLDKKTMNSLTQYCTYIKWTQVVESNGQEDHQHFGIMSWMFIYPGTKWCGAGNISESYEDLGPEVETDRCCREHDYCPDSIEGFGSKHGLDNNSPFTKSNCKCDDIFYKCLRKANTPSSNEVGQIYFNYIRMECFKEEHPIRGCRKYKGRFRPRCIEYELDKEQEPVWQFFDAKEYRSLNEKKTFSAEKRAVLQYILSPPPNSRNEETDDEIRRRLSSSLVNHAMNEMLSNSQKSSTVS